MNATNNLAQRIADILRGIGITLRFTPDSYGVVATTTITTADAKRAVEALSGEALTASWAPDNEDHSQAWLYVSCDS
jgi:hypothetical protein